MLVGVDTVADVSPALDAGTLDVLLRNNARAFYLSLRILPARLRQPIGLAYFIARAADTVTDAVALDDAERRALLEAIAAAIDDAGRLPKNIIAKLSDVPKLTDAERATLHALPRALELLHRLDQEERRQVEQVLRTLTEGMRMDIECFAGAGRDGIKALPDNAALERYTYLIAGCVGEFWTSMLAHAFPALRRWRDSGMAERGAHFGKALQLTNILRDLPSDLARGRCYLPAAALARHKLTPADLSSLGRWADTQQALRAYVKKTLYYYQDAREYILRLPRRFPRLRLAAFWPMIIGLATVDKLAQSDEWPVSGPRIKISRRRVYGILFLSLCAVFSNRLLESWMNRYIARIDRMMSLTEDEG